MNIVILSPHATRDALALRDRCGAHLIGWAGTAAPTTVPSPSTRASSASRVLSGSFPGRIVLRLLGADGSTQFARRVRRNGAATRMLEDADLIVAAEDDAVLAAWRAVEAGKSGLRAVYGLAAARVVLDDIGGSR